MGPPTFATSACSCSKCALSDDRCALRIAARAAVAKIAGRMQRLETIGWWFHDLAPSSLPRPQRLVTKWSESDRALVLSYLRSGTPLVDYPEPSYCRFECGEEAMGSRDLTDGAFVWPEGLAHYVERHDVKLPEHFLQHVRERQGVIAPFRAPKPRFGLYDRSAWERWGREQGASIDLGAFVVPDQDSRERIEQELGNVIYDEIVLCCADTREVVLAVGGSVLEVRQLRAGGAAPRRLAGWDDWPAFLAAHKRAAPALPEKKGGGMTMDAFLASMRKKHGLDDDPK